MIAEMEGAEDGQTAVDVHVLGYGRKQAEPTVINGVKVHWIWLPNPLYKKITLGGYPYSFLQLSKATILLLLLQ